MTLAVCSAWLPLPTPSDTWGSGRPRSEKNAPAMFVS